jgi:predicted amidophosphoribosyltransferase
MTDCSNCGEKLPEDANFCPKCGTRTAHGAETNAPVFSDEMRQAFAKMGTEIEKAFTIAAKEIRAAFQTARENVQKSMEKEQVVCEDCHEPNPGGSLYCYKCGKMLESKGAEEKA